MKLSKKFKLKLNFILNYLYVKFSLTGSKMMFSYNLYRQARALLLTGKYKSIVQAWILCTVAVSLVFIDIVEAWNFTVHVIQENEEFVSATAEYIKSEKTDLLVECKRQEMIENNEWTIKNPYIIFS